MLPIINVSALDSLEVKYEELIEYIEEDLKEDEFDIPENLELQIGTD